jgi:hypothetical protein
MQQEISGVLVGFSTPDHVDQVMPAIAEGPLSETQLSTLRDLYRRPPFCD